MTIQFAGRSLASGQFAGRALAGVYVGSTKLWAPDAPTPLQLIGTPQVYNVSINNGYTFAVPNAQAGDQVLIAAIMRMNSGNASTLDFSNDQDTAARLPGGYIDGGVAMQSAVMTVATAGTIQCTVAVPAACALFLAVDLMRGGTLMPDSANSHGATMPRAAGETPFALGNCAIASRGIALLFAYDGTFAAGTDADLQLNNGSAFVENADTTFVSTRHVTLWRTMADAAFSQSDLAIQTTTGVDATILFNWAPYTY
jgi:hypothetical protein